MTDLLLALALGVLGTGLLYASWTRRVGRRAPVIVAGWVAVCASSAFWVAFGGTEFGVTWAVAAVTVIAWGFTVAGRERRHADERRPQPRAAGDRPGRQAVGAAVARLLVVALLAGVASILVSMAVIAWLPWHTGSRYVLVLMGAPVVWGALAVWTGTTSRLPRAAGVLAGTSAVCALLLFV